MTRFGGAGPGRLGRPPVAARWLRRVDGRRIGKVLRDVAASDCPEDLYLSSIYPLTPSLVPGGDDRPVTLSALALRGSPT